MPTPDTARVYPGMCLLEACTASEGRGTTRPFEIFGAPWIDAARLKSDLDSLALPGVVFRELGFQPTFHKGVGRLCQGVQIHVTDPVKLRPVELGIAAMWALRRQGSRPDPVKIDPLDPRGIPDVFAWKAPPYEYEPVKPAIDILAGHCHWRDMLEAGAAVRDLSEAWKPDEAAWRKRREPFLLY